MGASCGGQGVRPLACYASCNLCQLRKGSDPLYRRRLLDHDGGDVVHRSIGVVGRQQRVDEVGRGRIVLRDNAVWNVRKLVKSDRVVRTKKRR